MTETKREHWDEVYRTKAADSVSWYQPTPEPSLRALDELRLPVSASLIDVGGGASSLVDRLVERGWSDLTVLDIAAPALDLAKARLGDETARVAWVIDDVTAWRPERQYDVWHDRAVFHFLTEPEQRLAYRHALEIGTASGSAVIIATFAPDGPERCSGLPVQRYDAAALAGEFSSAFAPQRDWREEHTTPGGRWQSFQWCVFRRR
ncbi:MULTISPECIES: class I SAM-dependent methyltransferase [unclassified Rhizobium]|uniref:class I SAM-dependent methyltransferase n=1 Tax=unclassified Rhizobium TaxID=2613769 RepID=UPI001A98CA7E|nr:MULTISPECIES: class I SAM-dependent methyltransferase [unclassified Rhizobium]MBX5161166.1 class I SAM-dependent methyltransferase [Rhizobium sp. NZLR8]MBX5167059.1 class I SAM-dependent methyltransferase [Rhizobium sp. NZLR4b]MBX5173058.1 class I SAM-dependent methyltransferase [Rhizobium sp. NZLR1b]MBX5185373.1 class I SAM-dependent methyltransferase [Rhizobium sp. NZLR5]MBX5190677.1 class I SAM-dependent methyltransferase [Rhizobium sp. NZLR3b]